MTSVIAKWFAPLAIVCVVAFSFPAPGFAGEPSEQDRGTRWSSLSALEEHIDCADCGGEIVGRYLIALGQNWHPGHFRCRGCDRDLDRSQFHREQDQAYCFDCYDVKFRIRCDICSQPIKANYYTDDWGNRFCEAHQDQPACSVCDRVISQKLTQGGVRYSDGRYVGNLCRGSAVQSIGELEALWSRVVEEMEQHGFYLADSAIPLSLVNQHDLRQGRWLDGRANGQTHTRYRVAPDGSRELTAAGIQVLFGLPEVYCGSVLAHELVHVWLAERQLFGLTREDEEGLCELGSWLWLQNSTDPLATYQRNRMTQSLNTAYSQGFLRAKQAQDQLSLNGLRRYVIENEELPDSDGN